MYAVVVKPFRPTWALCRYLRGPTWMGSFGGSMRKMRLFGRAWTALLHVSFLGFAGVSRAQAGCGVTRATPLRVEDEAGVDVLRAAANCTDGHSLEANWAGAITLDTPILIASGVCLSITGEDTLAEVSGGYQTRIFEVSPGGELTLTQLKLSGGTEKSGGAIYSNSSALVLDNCVFRGNVASNGDGGAVCAHGGNVTIIGGEFSGNNATGKGGAVAATGARLVVKEEATFESNKALVGGALYCSGAAGSGLAGSSTSCSLKDAAFTSNTATRKRPKDPRIYDFSIGVFGGGAVAFEFVSGNITGSVFGDNNAQHSGGALLGGNGTDITLNGCNFENNTAKVFGGAIAAASMTLGGNTQLTNNTATSSGGAVLGWDPSGAIIFNDVFCTQNSATDGGCFFATGSGVASIRTVMHNNEAQNGGCIYAYDGSDINIFGGNFMCRVTSRGGFLRAEDRSSVSITGGVVENNVAERRAGAIYLGDRERATLTIAGGTFRNNIAWESGGLIAATASSTVVEITGGIFSNNTATLYGGVVYLSEGASLRCENTTIRGNYAGDQGGGLYARESKWVNSSCDWVGNESPQGAALYLTHVENATLKHHTVTDNLAFSGSVVYIAESSVLASGVTFKSGVGLREDSSNRAVQSDGKSKLVFIECVFDGWLGDTVIYHRNPDPGSLCLDSCDFSSIFAGMAVFSLNSDAKIRNAVVGEYTFANGGTLNNTLALVNRALDCSSPNVCGPGECVDSTLGVLCECLHVDTCLDDGGRVSLGVQTTPDNETYSPDTVSFELVVSSAGNGTTYVIWELEFEADELELDVAPSGGILPPGGNVTVAVAGTPTRQDLGGDLVSGFYLTSVGSTNSSSTAKVQKLEVTSTFYLCSAFEYAKPLPNEIIGVSCEQCISISGGEGVDCDRPGATLASLPIRQGYWRWSRDTLQVHECLNSNACAGKTEISSADDYCQGGYEGPYCAVCAEGYGRGVSNACYPCDKTKGQILTVAGALSSVVVCLLLFFAVIFLVGGLDAVDTVHKSVCRKRSVASETAKIGSVPQTSLPERYHPERGNRTGYSKGTIAPALDFNWELQRCANVCDADQSSRASPSTRPWHDVTERAYTRRRVVGVGTATGLSDVPRAYESDAERPMSHHARKSTEAGAGVEGVLVNERAGVEASGGEKCKCCGLGKTITRRVSRLPLDKFKILVVTWQILTVFSSITEVEFPAAYASFLSWINVVNLDIGQLLSASCVLPPVNFYTRLLVTTLTPLVLAVGLMLTYQTAKHRAGIGSAGVIARRAAWSRHMAAGLLLTFLVFTSVSTLVFETFDCDDVVVDGEAYLRADYNLSCRSDVHSIFKSYALLMILVYPIGIPALYAAILWKNRELLNPSIHTLVKSDPGRPDEAAPRADSAEGGGTRSSMLCSTPMDRTKDTLSPQELEELKRRVMARIEHPDLVPSMFLWKDFGPTFFYYEVIECGRRMLLTGVLEFVVPHSWKQAGTACTFAFGTLLGFELMRPHLDPTDVWIYRLGCGVIFLSNFLALLIKVDAAGQDNRSALGVLLVAVNVLLALAVLLASWFTAQQSLDDSRDEDSDFNLAKVMLTAEQDAAEIIRLTREERTRHDPVGPVLNDTR